MINIPMKTSGSLNSDNILSINHTRIREALTRQDLTSVNRGAASYRPDIRPAPGMRATHDNPRTAGLHQSPAAPAGMIRQETPALSNLVKKGQKLSIGTSGQLRRLKIATGFHTTDSRCDIDLSAYLLDSSGKAPGDDWFVFYGQTTSPDGSVSLNVNGSSKDREIVEIDFTKLKPFIRKIVFVLTINEAFTWRLNFSMVRDAYIRLLDPDTDREILSFLLTDYYANVTSMMLGEVYLHNDTWKFNAIGNGVAKDLAGLCGLYGVQTN